MSTGVVAYLRSKNIPITTKLLTMIEKNQDEAIKQISKKYGDSASEIINFSENNVQYKEGDNGINQDGFVHSQSSNQQQYANVSTSFATENNEEKSKKEAKQAGEVAQQNYENFGQVVSKDEISYSDFIDYWLENDCAIDLKPVTVSKYENMSNLLLKPNLHFLS